MVTANASTARAASLSACAIAYLDIGPIRRRGVPTTVLLSHSAPPRAPLDRRTRRRTRGRTRGARAGPCYGRACTVYTVARVRELYPEMSSRCSSQSLRPIRAKSSSLYGAKKVVSMSFVSLSIGP